MNAKLPVLKIFLNAVLVIGIFSTMVFVGFCGFYFIADFAEGKHLELKNVTLLIKLYLGTSCVGVFPYFLLMLYSHNIIKKAFIQSNYKIDKIGNRVFKFKQDESEYVLKLLGIKNMQLQLISKDDKINITEYFVDLKSVTKILSQIDK